MVRVAITGGPGSGKSTVRSFFESQGAHAVDLDALAREAVEPGSHVFRELIGHFGEGILAPDGTLDRKKMRTFILEDPASKRALEKITHPAIQELLKKKLAQIELRFCHAVVVVEVPLLVEAGMEDGFDVIVLVDADPAVRQKRIMARDRCSAEEAEGLMGLHLSAKEKGLKAHFFVENGGAPEDTRVCVERILDKITLDASKTLTY